jgi:hypothetical protein
LDLVVIGPPCNDHHSSDVHTYLKGSSVGPTLDAPVQEGRGTGAPTHICSVHDPGFEKAVSAGEQFGKVKYAGLFHSDDMMSNESRRQCPTAHIAEAHKRG